MTAFSIFIHWLWTQPSRRAIGLFLLFWLIYAASGTWKWSPFNAHVYLAYAMLHGSFALINPPGYLELIRHDGQVYVAYGIAPTLLMLPFVAWWGLGFHQSLFCAALGAGSVTLWWSTLGKLQLDNRVRTWLTAVFGLGSLHWFYSGQNGNTWALMHITVIFGLMIAIHETLGRQRGWVVGLAFGLAVLARQPVFLALPFFIGMLWQDDRPRGGASAWQKEIGLLLGLGVLLAFNSYYNAARFGDPLDNGYARLILEHQKFRWGLFHSNYLWGNLYGYFLKLPERRTQFPWFDPTMDGFSIFLSLPALLFAFRADYRQRINRLALLACLGILGFYLVYHWSGFEQFGRRYSLDFLPFALLLIASGVKNRAGVLLKATTWMGAAVEIWGLFWWSLKGW